MEVSVQVLKNGSPIGVAVGRLVATRSQILTATGRARRLGIKVPFAINSVVNNYTDEIEKFIATATGGTRIVGRARKGLVPDLLYARTDPTTGKLNISTSDVKGIVVRAGSSVINKLTGEATAELKGGPVKIAGGKGGKPISLKDAKIELLTGFSEQGDEIIKSFEQANFAQSIQTLAANPSLIATSNDPFIVALRENIKLKAATINLVYINPTGDTELRTIAFNSDEIFTKGILKIKKIGDDKFTVDLEYPERIINQALNTIAEKTFINEKNNQALLRAYNNEMLTAIDSLLNNASISSVLAQLTKEIVEGKTQKITVDAPKGSVKIYSGTTILRTATIAPETRQPSLIDITIAVRNRTKLRMRRGVGRPRPPKIYERSGTFRGSIEAVADFRQGIVNYFYIPYYDRLEKYGYEINDLVEGSIRAITQTKFNRQFFLRRDDEPIL